MEGSGSCCRWRKPPEELLGVSWVSAGRREEKQVRMNAASSLGVLTPRNCTLQGHDGKLRTHRHGSSKDSSVGQVTAWALWQMVPLLSSWMEEPWGSCPNIQDGLQKLLCTRRQAGQVPPQLSPLPGQL